jgi:hypothetical protein
MYFSYCIQDEENLEGQLWDGIPVTMDRTAFDGEKKTRKQSRNWKNKNYDDERESKPLKKRNRSQDFENDDDFDQGHSSKRLNSGNVKEKKWEKSNSNWEIFAGAGRNRSQNFENDDDLDQGHSSKTFFCGNAKEKKYGNSKWEKFAVKDRNDLESKTSGSLERQVNENVVSYKKIAKEKKGERLDSKSENFAVTNKTDLASKTSDSLKKQNEFNTRNMCDSSQEIIYNTRMSSPTKTKVVLGKNNLTTSKSKWSKFLGSSSLTHLGEEENINDSNVGVFDQTKNASNISIPAFLINAQATRSKQNIDKVIDYSQSTQQSSFVSSKTLFNTEDDLDGDWWNV